MKLYAQNREDEIILNYFRSSIGTFLSLGENDGQTLSNVKALYDLGWNGVCVEPSKTAFSRLMVNQPKSENINVAVGSNAGKMPFWESGEHLGSGDCSLLSTLRESELERWEGTDNRFTKTECDVITFEMLMSKSSIKQFDLISIDCEGVDFEILSQINLSSLLCKMLIIETNSVDDQKYIDYCSRFGMKILHKNHENLIFAV